MPPVLSIFKASHEIHKVVKSKHHCFRYQSKNCYKVLWRMPLHKMEMEGINIDIGDKAMTISQQYCTWQWPPLKFEICFRISLHIMILNSIWLKSNTSLAYIYNKFKTFTNKQNQFIIKRFQFENSGEIATFFSLRIIKKAQYTHSSKCFFRQACRNKHAHKRHIAECTIVNTSLFFLNF